MSLSTAIAHSLNKPRSRRASSRKHSNSSYLFESSSASQLFSPMGIMLGGIVLTTAGMGSGAAIAQVSIPIPITPSAIPIPSAKQPVLAPEVPTNSPESQDEVAAQLEAELNSQLASEQWGKPRSNALPVFSNITTTRQLNSSGSNQTAPNSSPTTAEGIPVMVTSAPSSSPIAAAAAGGSPNAQPPASALPSVPPLGLPSDEVPLGSWSGRSGVKDIALVDMPWLSSGEAWATDSLNPSVPQAQYRVVVATPSSRHQQALKQMMPEAQALQRKQAMQVGAFAEWNRAISLQRALSNYGFQVAVEAL